MKSIWNMYLSIKVFLCEHVCCCAVFPVEVAPVTLQLDLGNLFQLDHLQLSFKVCWITSTQRNTLPSGVWWVFKSSLMVLYLCITEHLSFSAGSSSQCLCYREDSGWRQGVAARPVPGYRLCNIFSWHPHSNSSDSGTHILLHTAPYWIKPIPRSHRKALPFKAHFSKCLVSVRF